MTILMVLSSPTEIVSPFSRFIPTYASSSPRPSREITALPLISNTFSTLYVSSRFISKPSTTAAATTAAAQQQMIIFTFFDIEAMTDLILMIVPPEKSI